jgi:hypothetical protein
MSLRDLVICTGSGTLAAGVLTYTNAAIPAGACVLTNQSGNPALRTASVAMNCVITAGQVDFQAVSAAGAIVAAEVYTFNFVVLAPNWITVGSG